MCLSAHLGFSRKGKTSDGRVDLLLYRSVMLFSMVLRTRMQVWYLKMSGAELRSRWEGKKEEGTILLLSSQKSFKSGLSIKKLFFFL